jgi:hypothetical protein
MDWILIGLMCLAAGYSGFWFGRSVEKKATTLQWMTHLCKLPGDTLLEVLKVLPTPFALEARKIWKDVTGE